MPRETAAGEAAVRTDDRAGWAEICLWISACHSHCVVWAIVFISSTTGRRPGRANTWLHLRAVCSSIADVSCSHVGVRGGGAKLKRLVWVFCTGPPADSRSRPITSRPDSYHEGGMLRHFDKFQHSIQTAAIPVANQAIGARQSAFEAVSFGRSQCRLLDTYSHDSFDMEGTRGRWRCLA